MLANITTQDNDILSIFSPDVYTHVGPGWGAVQFVSLPALMSPFIIC